MQLLLFRLVSLFFLTCSVSLSLATSIDKSSEKKHLNVTRNAIYFEDAADTLTFEQARQYFAAGKGQKLDRDFVSFANSQSSFWIKLELSADSSVERVLSIPFPMLEHMTARYPVLVDDSLVYKQIDFGFAHPYQEREVDHYYNVIPINYSGTYYLQFRSLIGTGFPLLIEEREKIDGVDSVLLLFNGFYVGLVFFIVLSALGTFIVFKERVYLVYGFYALNTLPVVALLNGGAFRFWFPENEFVRTNPILCFFTFAQVAYLVFMISFLRLKSDRKSMYWICIVLIALVLLEIPLDFAGMDHQALMLSSLISIVNISFGTYCSAYVYYKGLPQALFIMVGNLALAFFVTYQVMGYFGLVDYNFVVIHGTEIGAIVEMLFFSLAIFDRSYRFKKARDLELSSRVDLLQQSEVTFRQQNKELEKMVDEKTRVLAAQNELLKMKNDELVSQSRKTREQNEIIERQNRMLIEQSEKLQQDMETRTSEIIKANEQLQYKNIQLEQFAFITSHNIRGPIARMIGLTNIFDVKQMDCDTNRTVIDKMKVCSAELDEIITDLTSIIAVQKGVDRIIEPVQISQIMKNIINTFEQQIQDYGIQINYDVATADRIISVKAYIHSIIYNLLSNAIKYRNTNNVLQINITSVPHGNDRILITFSDNGIGMDLDKIREKLFKPFQRFNEKLPGKGLGLYLIKTQVESLGGDIRIESELDKGTTFYIELPYVKM